MDIQEVPPPYPSLHTRREEKGRFIFPAGGARGGWRREGEEDIREGGRGGWMGELGIS